LTGSSLSTWATPFRLCSKPTSGEVAVQFDIQTARPLLARAPHILNALLRDLSDDLATANEGRDSWSPFDVVGHLIQGERNDWIPRVEHLLKYDESIPFPKFDRFAQFDASKGKSLNELLDTFAELRTNSLQRLDELQLTPADLVRTGTHPAFGRVTLNQLLATWVAHDLDHLQQITRVIGRQFAEAVGPWSEYLRIVRPI
ncbi:MAG: DinB family protein, partial [Gemmatimonadaceae bacterium]